MNALVLSGGGAKGAFQVGALKKVFEEGIDFDVISGVSVGSLNGAMIAQNKFKELEDVWNKVNNDQIYEKYSNFRIFWRNLIGSHKSLYGFEPLKELIQTNIKKEDFVKRYYVGLTSLNNGRYYSLTPDDFHKSYDLQQAILASSLMPIVWDPVQVLTKTTELKDCVDGGLRNVAPFSDVIDSLPDHIYIISCHTGKTIQKQQDNIIDITLRTLDIMVSEIVNNDIEALLRINNLVLQAEKGGVVLWNQSKNRPYKYFETTLIKPKEDLGDALDFNQKHIQRSFEIGYKIASDLVK